MRWLVRPSRALGVAGAVTLLWMHPSTAQQLPVTPARVAAVDAQRLYAGACATCHGRLGDGNGPSSARLGTPQPRDFTAGMYKFRSTPTGSLPTDDDIYRTISRGVPGTWMPRWEAHLSPAQRWALVRYIKEFSDFFAEEDPDPSVEVPPEPSVMPEMIQEGRWVYALLKCWQCHGPLGRGDGPSAADLTDDWDRKIVPYDFTRGDYKAGLSPSDVYRTLVTGLDGTPMPAFEATIVAFPGGRDADVESAREVLDATELRELRAYLAGQPTEDALPAMPEADRAQLVQRRLWALVYYLRSLGRGKGAFYWLFGENPELQTGAGGR